LHPIPSDEPLCRQPAADAGRVPECARFPVSSAKTQQALQFIDTTAEIFQSIHLQL
jgi:hypothetical protein